MKPVLWLFGLPSSGKTTLSRALRDHLQAAGTPVVLLDGDDLRSGLCADLGFSDADRSENLRRAAHLAQLLAAQGNTVICAFVTPKEHHRALVRQILGEHVRLIHIDCPLEVCIARDVKGLYAKAAAQQMTGMTGTQDGFEPPARTDAVIQTHAVSVADALSATLHAALSALA
ncbi:MAG: adenylyl-sulfate kinase [Prosthecobacter sp.]|uniref:adenylyl-sulfate kinase n=1 Tax=Prosthecobacter sp. TaxID=1965333 RepID=UPI0038FFE3FE